MTPSTTAVYKSYLSIDSHPMPCHAPHLQPWDQYETSVTSSVPITVGSTSSCVSSEHQYKPRRRLPNTQTPTSRTLQSRLNASWTEAFVFLILHQSCRRS
ncbi:hypothetical protein CRENBAI_004978 [Crenichthys baileyi]|uniref:Uncharacterized protein n=1 Tax=Crenichthys baileyi TaxID=28760 RepID=A0AAV9R7Q9_9TELE